MRRQKGQKGVAGVRARLPAIGATLLAPILAYFVVRSAAFALSGAAAAYAGAALPPTEHSAALKGIVRASQTPKFAFTPEMLAMAHEGAVAAPLAHEPFFIAAKASEKAGRRDRALALMEEARRRRPTHTATRAHLLIYYGQGSNYRAFLNEMDYVLRRSPTAQQRLLPEMTRLVAVPEGREALAQLLAKDPAWRQDFLNIAADRKVNVEDAAALVSRVRAKKPNGDLRPENAFLVQAMVSAGQYARAKAAWTRSLPKAAGDDNLLFDGDFRGSSAPPPFNWNLKDTEVGRASIADARSRERHLEVEYFGGRNIVLAEQLLALASGNYRLSLLARSEGDVRSTIYWRVGCLPDNRDILRAELRNMRSSYSPFGGNFAVPAQGCAGQTLQLVAEAGDVAAPASLRTSKLRIASR